METSGLSRRIPRIPAVVFLLLSFGIMAAGRTFYVQERAYSQKAAAENLSAVADLKISQIVRWRQERLADADLISRNPFNALRIRPFAENPSSKELIPDIRAWMELFTKSKDYRSVILTDPRGNVLLSVGTDTADMDSQDILRVSEAVRTGKSVLSDFHRREDTGLVRIEVFAPLLCPSGTTDVRIGVLILGIDPNLFLYPRIQSWPTPSPSAETLLIRRNSHNVLFLNELRHRKNTALSLRLPITDDKLPAARAVLGFEGIFEGADYRNVPVLSAVRRIPDSQWAMVAKVDEEEVFAPLLTRARLIAAVVGGLILAMGFVFLFWWKQREAEFYRLESAERERAGRELRESEERFRHLVDNMKSGVAVYEATDNGRDFVFMDFNKAGERIDDEKKENLIGKSIFEARPGVEKFGLIEVMRRVWETGIPEPHPVTLYEDNRLTKWYENFVYKLPSGEIVAVFDDVTERKNLETQLRQAQKMEAIGQLAGGVAHDFNNLLYVITGYAEMSMELLSPEAPLHSNLREIMKAAKRAKYLVSQLLLFARRDAMKLKILDLNDVLANLMKMIGRVIGENVTIELHPDPNLEKVYADRGQIEQILMNLCVNARDAMPEGGSIVIETANVSLDLEFCERHPWSVPGNYVLMTVSDTGTGISHEIRERIFEPFFTTKEIGKGTGLGLAVVYGIVKSHQGLIHIYSESGQGAVFKIYLPIAENQPASGQTREGSAKPSAGGKETLLVAEDEEAVRDMIVRILQKAGYRVFSAGDGEEAISIFEKHSREIALVLTDVVMPKVSGHKVYEQVRAIRADMPVIFTTGYGKGLPYPDFLSHDHYEIINKPCSPYELLRSIRMVLDNRQHHEGDGDEKRNPSTDRG